MMEITYEVTLDYGEDGPDEGEATPTSTDITEAVQHGLEGKGFSSVDVRTTQL
jgi:hypothetical protein